MFVLLRALFVCDRHALAGELAAAQLADAGDDVADGVVELMATNRAR